MVLPCARLYALSTSLTRSASSAYLACRTCPFYSTYSICRVCLSVCLARSVPTRPIAPAAAPPAALPARRARGPCPLASTSLLGLPRLLCRLSLPWLTCRMPVLPTGLVTPSCPPAGPAGPAGQLSLPWLTCRMPVLPTELPCLPCCPAWLLPVLRAALLGLPPASLAALLAQRGQPLRAPLPHRLSSPPHCSLAPRWAPSVPDSAVASLLTFAGRRWCSRFPDARR